jgi:hypothetical protein
MPLLGSWVLDDAMQSQQMGEIQAPSQILFDDGIDRWRVVAKANGRL